MEKERDHARLGSWVIHIFGHHSCHPHIQQKLFSTEMILKSSPAEHHNIYECLFLRRTSRFIQILEKQMLPVLETQSPSGTRASWPPALHPAQSVRLRLLASISRGERRGLLPVSPVLARPLSLPGTYQPRFDWRVHENSSGLFLHGEREWRRTARVGTVGVAGGLCLLTRRGEKGRRKWWRR